MGSKRVSFYIHEYDLFKDKLISLQKKHYEAYGYFPTYGEVIHKSIILLDEFLDEEVN